MNNTNVKVEFLIFCDSLHPKVITDKLNIASTQSWVKGENINGKSYKRKDTCWIVSTEYEESLDINIQLSKLVAMIQNKKEALIDLGKVYDVKYVFEFVIKVRNNQTPAMYFEREFLDFVNDIHAVLDIDMYVSSDS